jgi:uncharacterized protein YcfJ
MDLAACFPAAGFAESRRPPVDKTPAYYIFLGLLIGALVGVGIGAANGNLITGMQLGALTGLFIGWFIAAPALKK